MSANDLRRWALRSVTLLAILVFAVLGAATSSPPEGDTTSSNASPSSDSNQAGSAALHELESHLQRGRAYGQGPGGEVIASGMRELLDTSIGDALAVQVVPGNPERIVVVLKLPDLRRFSTEMRESWLEDFGTTVREGFGATDSTVVVGIRGAVFYGAVATMEPGSRRWNVRTGRIVSTQPLEEALTRREEAAQPGQVRMDVYGRIEPADAVDAVARRRADRHAVELAEGARLTVTMSSPEVDSYLFLLGPDGSRVAQNDDHGDSVNARIVHTAAAGTYTVIATTLGDDERGPYALRVRATSPASAADPAPAADPTAEPAPAP